MEQNKLCTIKLVVAQPKIDQRAKKVPRNDKIERQNQNSGRTSPSYSTLSPGSRLLTGARKYGQNESTNYLHAHWLNQNRSRLETASSDWSNRNPSRLETDSSDWSNRNRSSLTWKCSDWWRDCFSRAVCRNSLGRKR